MCGIVGMAGNLTYQARTGGFRDLLDVCQVRGRDSTGVVKVDDKLNFDWVKQVGPPTYLVDTKAYDQCIERGNATALIGHTRSKTSGDVTKDNAHPFEHGDIVGVHNGTLRFITGLDTYTYQKVDSDVLYGHLSLNGPEETFNQIEGAWACVWWDNHEKELRFIRNNERPLYFCWSEDAEMMFWASEIWMFSVLNRRGIKFHDGGENGKMFNELPENTLWRFTFNPNAKKDEKFIIARTPTVIERKKMVGNFQPPTGRTSASTPNGGTANRAGFKWDEKTKTFLRDSKPEGGEVATPFQPDELNDGLEDLIYEAAGRGRALLKPPENPPSDDTPTQEESETSGIGNVEYLNTSLRKSASRTPSNSSMTSRKKILSLPSRSSATSQQDNKRKLLESSSPPHTNCSTEPPRRQPVSFREIAGAMYVTDNKTSNERSFKEVVRDTGGSCFFCKDPIMSVTDISEFFGEKRDHILCVDCDNIARIGIA